MSKATDMLELYLRFMTGAHLTKHKIGEIIGKKSERTVQRYIADLNTFFKSQKETEQFEITLSQNYYVLKKNNSFNFEKEQILAILKILISSRGLSIDEIQQVINNLMKNISDNDRKIVKKAIQSELTNYKSMNHGDLLLQKIWELNHLIQQGKIIQFEYFNSLNKGKIHTIQPMYITYSELYFYLVGVNENKQVLIFRVDRIQEFETKKGKFNIPSSPYIREGELKKRIYFMYGGDWKKVTFEFTGGIIEAVLDRFPTAQLIKKDYKNNSFPIEIEVVGDGILMWLLSQGSKVKVISPNSLKMKHINELKRMLDNYEKDKN